MPNTYDMDANYPLSTSVPVRPGQSDFLRWQQDWVSEGVMQGHLNSMKCIAPGGLVVRVAPGRGTVRGVFWEWGTARDLAISPNIVGNARIDRIVVRLLAGTPVVRLLVIEGTPAVTPIPPPLVRTTEPTGVPLTWDLPLCQVLVGPGVVAILPTNLTENQQFQSGAGFVYVNPATAAATLVVADGRLVHAPVTGATTISAITAPTYAGSTLVLEFLTDGAVVVPSPTMQLQGAQNFISKAGGTLTLQWTGSAWQEIGRGRYQGPANLVLAAPGGGPGEVALRALTLSHLPTGIGSGTLGPDAYRANLLTNGGFETWLRGPGPFTLNSRYTADRWMPAWGASSFTQIAQDSTHVHGTSTYAMACVYTHVSPSQIKQAIEDWRSVIGQWVTFGLWVNCFVASAVRLAITEGVAGTLGAYHTGGGGWEFLTVSHLFSGVTTEATVYIALDASGSFVFDSGTVVLGQVASEYQYEHPAAAQDRAQRYYEAVGQDSAADVVVAGYGNGTGVAVAYETISFRTEKSAIPTVTVNGTWAKTNAPANPTHGAQSRDGVRLDLASTSGVTTLFYAHNGGGGANMTAETA